VIQRRALASNVLGRKVGRTATMRRRARFSEQEVQCSMSSCGPHGKYRSRGLVQPLPDHHHCATQLLTYNHEPHVIMQKFATMELKPFRDACQGSSEWSMSMQVSQEGTHVYVPSSPPVTFAGRPLGSLQGNAEWTPQSLDTGCRGV
jgi:hypothetical protein